MNIELSGFGTNAGSISVTSSLTIPSGLSDSLLLAIVEMNNDNFETVDTLTWNGAGLTLWQTIATVDDARIEVWYKTNPESGLHDLVTTYSASLLRQSIVGYIVLSGVDQTTPLSGWTTDAAQNGSTTPSVTVTCEVDDLVCGAICGESISSLTPASDLTELWNTNVSGVTYGGFAYKIADSTSEPVNYTMGGSDHRILAGFAIKPTSAPAELTLSVWD